LVVSYFLLLIRASVRILVGFFDCNGFVGRSSESSEGSGVFFYVCGSLIVFGSLLCRVGERRKAGLKLKRKLQPT